MPNRNRRWEYVPELTDPGNRDLFDRLQRNRICIIVRNTHYTGISIPILAHEIIQSFENLIIAVAGGTNGALPAVPFQVLRQADRLSDLPVRYHAELGDDDKDLFINIRHHRFFRILPFFQDRQF